MRKEGHGFGHSSSMVSRLYGHGFGLQIEMRDKIEMCNKVEMRNKVEMCNKVEMRDGREPRAFVKKGSVL